MDAARSFDEYIMEFMQREKARFEKKSQETDANLCELFQQLKELLVYDSVRGGSKVVITNDHMQTTKLIFTPFSQMEKRLWMVATLTTGETHSFVVEIVEVEP
jgi:hypothetical protein